jgi:hypothetical protein
MFASGQQTVWQNCLNTTHLRHRTKRPSCKESQKLDVIGRKLAVRI